MERFSRIAFVAATTARTSRVEESTYVIIDQVENEALNSYLREGWTPIEFVPCGLNSTSVGIVAVLGKP